MLTDIILSHATPAPPVVPSLQLGHMSMWSGHPSSLLPLLGKVSGVPELMPAVTAAGDIWGMTNGAAENHY